MFQRYAINAPIRTNYALMDDDGANCHMHLDFAGEFDTGCARCGLYVPSHVPGLDFDFPVTYGRPKEYVALRIIQHILGYALGKLSKLVISTDVQALLDRRPGMSNCADLRDDVLGFVHTPGELGLEIKVPVEPCPEMDKTEPFTMALCLVCSIYGNDPRDAANSAIKGLKQRMMATLEQVGEKLDDYA